MTTDKTPDVLFVSVNSNHPEKGPLYNTSSVPPRPCGVSEMYYRAETVDVLLKQARDALRDFVYETHQLSPLQNDGPHLAKISRSCLDSGREGIIAIDKFLEGK